VGNSDCRVKKTVDGRGYRSHIGGCDGEPSSTPEKKQATEQTANKKPQKRTETMVFEEEKVSHNQESDSDMCENENHYRRIC
jgi:hypothetical protein